MSFLTKLNGALKKIRKSGWKLTLIILLVYLSANPYYLSQIPFVYESFLYANNVYYTVMDFIYRGIEIPVIGSILGFIISFLPIAAACIVLLWVLSLIGVPITNLIIKAPLKKKPRRKPRPSVTPIKHTPNSITTIEKPERPVKPMTIENIQDSEVSTNTSEPVRRPIPPRTPAHTKKPAPANSKKKASRGSSKLLTFLEKVISFIRLKILKIDTEPVFFREDDSYIRVQRLNADDTVGGTQLKADELLKWNSQNSISIPYTYKGEEFYASAYRTEGNKSAFIRMHKNYEDNELIPNEPWALWILNENNENVLVMVITWIGDVFND